jgi:hypothetical protein
MEDLRTWRCQNGHGLGVVKRNGSGMYQLLLYRHAVATDGVDDVQVDVMAVVEGSVMDIRCEICGEMRTWVIGQAALERLLEMVRRKETK